jgi:hypothetical protein
MLVTYSETPYAVVFDASEAIISRAKDVEQSNSANGGTDYFAVLLAAQSHYVPLSHGCNGMVWV